MAKIKKRKRKAKPKPVINYPPVPTKKWIPPEKRPKKPKPPPAYVKPEGITQKLKISSLKKVWNQYIFYGNSSIIVGHFSQTHKKYSFKTNGYQGACNCAIACAFAYLYKMVTWNRYSLDRILDLGDVLYLRSTQQPTCIVEVPPDKICNSFFLDKKKISLSINSGPKITERLSSVSEEKAKLAFQKAVEDFFKKYPSGIFSLSDKYLAIWIQDDAYYMFDPTEHDEYGKMWIGIPGGGLSLLCRCKSVEFLAENIYNNVTMNKDNSEFEIVECTVQRIVEINTTPPEYFEDIVMVEPPPEPTEKEKEEEKKEIRPVDVIEEKIRKLIQEDLDETSVDIKIYEISPYATDELSISKRPSWLQEGPINKGDVCKFQIPQKPEPIKPSYYIELVPQKIGILRGSTCQTDKKFSKYQGRQSMGNAISALTMLRLYKSKTWVPKIVNKILKYGDQFYRDAMIRIPRTQSLRLSNFEKKTEMEGSNFSPVIEDYAVIGKLLSQDYDVLDLHPALESFLADNECCVILGPLILAVWVEDGKFYMFDPNERDKDGKAIARTATIGENIIQVENTSGLACVVWFTDLKDLVDLYMSNVEKSHKMNPFYLSKVQINDFVEMPGSWFNFSGLLPGKWILRGTMSQANPKFSKDSRNVQSPAMCLIALAFQLVYPEKDWTRETIDEILTHGDKLYVNSIENLTNNSKLISKLLMLNEINKKYKLFNKEANFEIGECLVNGIINAKGQNDLMSLKKGCEEFFRDNDVGVVTSHNISVAVWKKYGIFYFFDSHNRDEKGLATGYGTACVVRSLDLDELSKSIEINLSPGKEDFYNIHRIRIELLETADGDLIRPPLNNFVKINENTSILRSLCSEISKKYDINCGKQTLPMCLTALSFNKLKPSKDWTKQDLDEILNKGDNLYVDTMNKIQKERDKELEEALMPVKTDEENQDAQKPKDSKGSAPEKKEKSETDAEKEVVTEEEVDDGCITSANVNNEFNIGLNKIKVAIEDRAEGNIEENLKESLKSFFEAEQTEDYFSQEAVLESKPLSVAMWRDDKVFYVFDSKPRDANGLVIGMEDWSAIRLSPPPAPPPPETAEEGDKETDENANEKKEVKIDDNEIKDEFTDNSPVIKFTDFEDSRSGVFDQTGNVEKYLKGLMQDEEEGPEKDEGIKYFPVVHKSSAFWREQEKNGRACVVRFIKVNDLVDYVYGNIPPKVRKDDNFNLKSVKITNIADIKTKLKPDDEINDVYAGNWYDFDEIDYGRWILRGTMTLMNKMFPEKNRGKQIVPACLMSLVIAYVFTILCFNNCTVDTILKYGDKLFTYVKRMKKAQLKKNTELKLKDDEIDWLLDHEDFEIRDITKKLCISKFSVHINVEENAVVGDINAQNFEDIFDVKRGLEDFFRENTYGLLQCKDLTVGIWRGKRIYYMFDGLNRGPNGIKSPTGTACVTRYLDLEKMTEVFLENLPKYGKNNFSIHKLTMIKDICPRQREPKVTAKLMTRKVRPGGFHKVIPGKCIIQGNMSQEDPKFGKGSDAMSAPIAIIALTMSLIHKPNTWSKPIIDDILELGAELYEDSMDFLGYDYNPWEEKLDVYRSKKDYKIGMLKANCELRHMDQKGIIDVKDQYILNLRQGIEKFFEENTHGIIVSEPVTLAIWEEEQDNAEPLIYMFDPNPRGPTGMPLNTGTACVVTFVNAKVASDHIVGCILNPSKKLCEFTIVPVEIVVGNVRTMRKVKKTRTKSQISVLPRCSKLVADEEKKTLRKIVSIAKFWKQKMRKAENERKRKEAKRLHMIGRIGYYTMKGGDAIIRGYRSQNSMEYCQNSRNNQDIPNCIAALVMHKLVSVDNWHAKYIDFILNAGDQLYIDSYIAYGPKDKKLGLENVMRKFFFKNLEIHVTVYKPIISEIFTVANVNKILNVFFQQEPCCMLNYTDQWVSIIFKSGYFYLFDPHERYIDGNVVKKDETGTAVVLRFESLNSLSLKVVQNLCTGTDEIKQFSLWLISAEIK